MKIKRAFVVFLCIVVTTSAFSSHLKADLSVSGQPGGETGFTNWAIANSTTKTPAAIFGDITFVANFLVMKGKDQWYRM